MLACLHKLKSPPRLPFSVSRLIMARGLSIDISPPVHRGMKKLDKSAFCTSVTVLAAKVPPAKAGKLLAANELKTYVRCSINNSGCRLNKSMSSACS